MSSVILADDYDYVSAIPALLVLGKLELLKLTILMSSILKWLDMYSRYHTFVHVEMLFCNAKQRKNYYPRKWSLCPIQVLLYTQFGAYDIFF